MGNPLVGVVYHWLGGLAAASFYVSFGPHRAMFARDLPTDRQFGNLDRHPSVYHAIVADFTLAGRRALFGGTANRPYRLDLDLENRP